MFCIAKLSVLEMKQGRKERSIASWYRSFKDKGMKPRGRGMQWERERDALLQQLVAQQLPVAHQQHSPFLLAPLLMLDI